MNSYPDTTIVVLAAGAASRMGESKQLLPYGDSTLLEYHLALAHSLNPAEVVCVLGANAATIQQKIDLGNVRTVLNPDWKSGLSSSLQAGLAQVDGSVSRMLVMLADQPWVDQNHLRQLLDGNPELTSATLYPHGPGVPAVFPSSWFEDLRQIDGDKGAKKLLMDRREELRLVHPHILPFDVDTPDDYERLVSGSRKRD